MGKVTFLPVSSGDVAELGVLMASSHCDIPLFSSFVPAGFPSPAEGWVERTLDLNDLCIRSPDSTYFVRVRGDSMIDAGILDGSVLTVDRAIPATHNAIVIARVDSELTVKRYEERPVPRLVPANPAYSLIELTGRDVEIIGVVTFTISRLWP